MINQEIVHLFEKQPFHPCVIRVVFDDPKIPLRDSSHCGLALAQQQWNVEVGFAEHHGACRVEWYVGVTRAENLYRSYTSQ